MIVQENKIPLTVMHYVTPTNGKIPDVGIQ
jgi:hypothetical protein